MNQKDLCFLGLLALAYLYLDATSEQAVPTDRRLAGGDEPASVSPAGGTARVRYAALVALEPTCPRDAEHLVSHRKDGAMWCRGCDRAYYPSVAEWSAALATA